MKILDQRGIKALKWLDGHIQSCKRCRLWKEGRAKPYWTKYSRFALIGESPWTNEVKDNEPFVGDTGELLWKLMKRFGFRKQEFIVINSVNCKPSFNPSNKPTLGQIQLCHPWIRMYIKVVKPEKILVMGNFAMSSMIGEKDGIVSKTGFIRQYFVKFEQKGLTLPVPVVLSVHPSYAIYNETEGMLLLKKGIKAFKRL